MTTVEINAEGKILGRVASEIASTLRGKTTPAYRRDRMPDILVVVKNADKFRVSGNKLTEKMYYRFSGYPGGLKKTTLDKLLVKKPDQALFLAVKRMLPSNHLRARLLKRLTLETSPKK